MAFKEGTKWIGTTDLANRDNTYATLALKHNPSDQELVLGTANNSAGIHAEVHVMTWIEEHLDLVRSPILQLFLTKSPCNACGQAILEMAITLNRAGYIESMHIIMLGMYRGIRDQESRQTLRGLHNEQPLINLFAWNPGFDPFSERDQILRGVVLGFDNSEEPRRGTDVLSRTTDVYRFLRDELRIPDPYLLRK